MPIMELDELVSEDDTFHDPGDDPWWTETVWFGWMVPERRMIGSFYPFFRPNLGVQAGGVWLFDHTAEVPWEVPFFDFSWHIPMTPGLDLRHADLPNGMSIRALEPNRVFQLRYSHPDLELDIRYEALFQPLLSRATPPFTVGSHLDQPGRVTGRMNLRGEEIPIDCYSMRDRAWGPRRDGRQPKVGYSFGTASDSSAFLSISVDRRGDEQVSTGFLMRDGVWSELASGTRKVERDAGGRPARIMIDAVDELGRRLVTEGDAVSRHVALTYPSMLSWTSLTRWELDGGECWGEDQEIWHPNRWRAFAASVREDQPHTS
jgi:hypothetical protein